MGLEHFDLFHKTLEVSLEADTPVVHVDKGRGLDILDFKLPPDMGVFNR